MKAKERLATAGLLLGLCASEGWARPIIESPSCKPPWFERARFESLLLVETASSSFQRIRLKIPVCDAPLVVEIQAWTATSTATAQISLQDVPPPTRLRALALAIAELRPRAPKARPPPSAKPAGAPTGRTEKAQVPRPQKTKTASAAFSVLGAMALHTYPGRQTTLLGGRLGLALPMFFETLFGAVDLGVLGGRQDDALGQIEVLTVAMGLGVNLRGELGPLRLGGGPRFEVGWARLRGVTEDPAINASSASGLITAVYLNLGLDYRLTQSIGAALSVMGGWVVKGFAAQEAAGISGGVIAVQLGLSWAL